MRVPVVLKGYADQRGDRVGELLGQPIAAIKANWYGLCGGIMGFPPAILGYRPVFMIRRATPIVSGEAKAHSGMVTRQADFEGSL